MNGDKARLELGVFGGLPQAAHLLPVWRMWTQTSRELVEDWANNSPVNFSTMRYITCLS